MNDFPKVASVISGIYLPEFFPFKLSLSASRLKVAMDKKMPLPPLDSLNDFISKVFIAIAIGGLVFALSLFLAMMIYPHFPK
jgi:hypothetical protein